MITLVKEDGSARVDANSYAAVADGDAYHGAHLYPEAWNSATFDSKAVALVMATRLIDAECEFLGFRKSSAQALEWPRVQVPDREAIPSLCLGPQYVSSATVPPCVVYATCELARELLKTDRTAAPVGEGLKYSAVSGSIFTFDKTDRRPVITEAVEAMLKRVLASSPRRTSVARLIRA
jgi:hypothetical protein